MTRITLERGDATLVGSAVGRGPTALLLHAGGERRGVWDPVANHLAARGFRAVAYDLRGHGESGGVGAERIHAHADDVAAKLDSEAVPAVVVGASLGGLAALLALRDPRARAMTAGLVLADVVPDLAAERVRAYLNGLRSGLAERPLVADVLGRRSELRAAGAQLGELPILLVRGGKSPLTDADARRLSALAPTTRVEVVPGAGHLVAAEAPHLLAGLVHGELEARAVRGRRLNHVLDWSGAGDIDHPGGTLRDHLDRTAELLDQWGSAPWVVDAGRLHAAYGTDGFPKGLPGVDREKIIAAAGTRTEGLVDLYGHCSRADTYPTFLSHAPRVIDRRSGDARPLGQAEVRAFAELTVANELDVMRHSPTIAATHGRELLALFRAWRPLISAGGWRAIEEASARIDDAGASPDPAA
ncbi:MAG: hypothetical protein QOF65_526 [Thermoleophilaceae bacterium]|nr:hypothetical protein [Thermoleophilaceae bacterium]